MKKIRFGVLLVCLCLFSSFVLTAAADNDQTEAAESYKADPVLVQYAAELSGFTSLPYYKGENAARYIAFKQRFEDCSWETVITDVNIGLDNDYYTDAAVISSPGSVDVLVNKYHYLPSDFVPDDLEKVNSAYCFKTEMLVHDARVAFETMCADARSLGYELYATSSYRSYDRQVELYKTYGIPDVTTARPGYSEHQTGLAVDVIHHAGSNKDLDQSSVFKWYYENACKYGFILRYDKEWQFLTGCSYEPWHLRYVGVDLAIAVKLSNLSYDEYYTRYVGIPDRSEGDGEDDAVGLTSVADVAAGGTGYTLSCFDVLGHTYFKLRDIAVILSGSDFEFDVAWDGQAGLIQLLVGEAYTSDPTLSDLEPGLVYHMTATMPPIKIDSEPYELEALMVQGSNYYTLESLGALLDFTVTADDAGILQIESPFIGGDTEETAA